MSLKKITIKIFPLLLVFILVVTPVFVFGDGKGGPLPPSDYEIENPIQVDSINDFLKIVLEGVIKAGFPIVALAIIYSGFLFVTAQGKPDKLEKAKKAITYSIIGAAILLGSWTLSILIANTVEELGKPSTTSFLSTMFNYL